VVQRQWETTAHRSRRDGSRRSAKGCDGQLTKAWMEHLGVGCGRNFIGAQRGEEQRKGDGFGRVPGTVAGWVRNGFHPRRSEANVWGP
jgi:hypothetical protein